ncbi:SDR family NAD(P)-dependent oxidoreductase [Cyanobium sp. ATX 6F1]|nr:SDR family NAD(P)-dependent oxidoreductase [Cyanobium sp. ATX 6F1]
MLVLGGGYTGERFARAVAALGVPVVLTRRQPPRPAPPVQPLISWDVFDGEKGLLPSDEAWAGTTHVLVTIPPATDGRDPVLTWLAAHLARLPLRWLGYLSTTGVYGDTQGAWVNEDAPTPAGLGRSQARLNCEAAWRSSGLPVQVFRLPAIYGPQRSAFRSLALGQGRLIHKRGQVFCRIHVDDIVGALLHCLSLEAPHRPPVLNLSDDEPCPTSETLGYAAHLLGCPLPEVQSFEEIAATMGPMAQSFWLENRRVCNRRLCQELGYVLRYRTYREGFRSILLAERQEGSEASNP